MTVGFRVSPVMSCCDARNFSLAVRFAKFRPLPLLFAPFIRHRRRSQTSPLRYLSVYVHPRKRGKQSLFNFLENPLDKPVRKIIHRTKTQQNQGFWRFSVAQLLKCVHDFEPVLFCPLLRCPKNFARCSLQRKQILQRPSSVAYFRSICKCFHKKNSDLPLYNPIRFIILPSKPSSGIIKSVYSDYFINASLDYDNIRSYSTTQEVNQYGKNQI